MFSGFPKLDQNLRRAIAHAFLNYLQEDMFPRKRAVSPGATTLD
jgi:hypothetical protein